MSQTFDAGGRLVGRSIARGSGVLGAQSESYAYDGLGRLLEASDEDSIVTRHWDSLGRMLADVQDGLTAVATYDGATRSMVLSYPGGRTVSRSYDAIGRLVAVMEGATNHATYAWRGARRLHERTNGVTGLVWGLEYDAGFRVSTSRHRVGTAGAVVDERFSEWDRADNRIAYSDNQTQSQRTFSYDSADRLIASQRVRSGVTEVDTYTLDKAGNRTEVGGPLMAGAYELSGLNALVHQYTTTPEDERGYDPNGNLAASWKTEIVPGNPPAQVIVDARSYAYDWRNQMVRVDLHSTNKRHEYTYDALGRRTRKIVDTTGTPKVTRYVYFGDQVIEERSGSGAIEATYVHGAGLDEPLSMRRDQGAGFVDHHYLQDDHGNVVVVTDGAGQIVERYDYTDYGLPLDVTSGQPHAGTAIGNPYRFTGLRFDEETGLYWVRSRYYDPKHGRFTSRDSIGHWGDRRNVGNGLTWCANSPWVLVDPRGYSGDWWDKFCAGCEAIYDGLTTDAGQFLSDVTRGFGILAADGLRDIAAGQRSTEISVPSGLPPLIADYLASVERVHLDSAADANSHLADFLQALAEAHTVGDVATAVDDWWFDALIRRLLKGEAGPGDCVMPLIGLVTRRGSRSSGGCGMPGGGRGSGGGDFSRGGPPRAPGTGDFVPDPGATGPHTTLGTRTGSDGKPYTQGATFDGEGKFLGRTDVTNHGRADHTAPHFHPATGANSANSPAQPIPTPKELGIE